MVVTDVNAAAIELVRDELPGVQVVPTTAALVSSQLDVYAPCALGNALILVGVFDDGEDLMRGWMLERVGLIGAITSWGTYSIAVATIHPGSAISYGLTLCIALAHTVRLVATIREETSTRRAIRTHGAK